MLGEMRYARDVGGVVGQVMMSGQLSIMLVKQATLLHAVRLFGIKGF